MDVSVRRVAGLYNACRVEGGLLLVANEAQDLLELVQLERLLECVVDVQRLKVVFEVDGQESSHEDDLGFE